MTCQGRDVIVALGTRVVLPDLDQIVGATSDKPAHWARGLLGLCAEQLTGQDGRTPRH